MRHKLLYIVSTLLALCLIFCLPVSALADRPTVTLHPTGKNADGSNRTVAPGGSISFTAEAYNYSSRTWRIVSPDAKRVYLAGEINQAFPGLVVSGASTNTLTLANVPEGMNNWCVEVKFSNYEGYTMSRGAIIHVSGTAGSGGGEWTPPADVSPAPVIGDGGEIDVGSHKPTVTSQLTADRSYQTAGGSYSFTGVGANYTQRYWYLISPGGSYYEITANVLALFPNMGVMGTETNTLTFSNVPLNLNNWSVQLRYINSYGEVYSNAVVIRVVDPASPAPVPTGSGAGLSAVISAREPVNLRATPNGTVIGSLQPGTAVTVTDRSNPQWYAVTTGKVSGYVAARLISMDTGSVVVTKNPTGESAAVGGTVTFIAHARNASAVTWRLVSADTRQTVYAVNAPSSFSGVKVYGADTDTLTLSNVPAGLDGWSAEAMFSGPGGPVYSTGARITVSAGTSYVSPAQSPTATPAVTAAPVGSGLNITALPQPLELAHGRSGMLSVSVVSERETVHYQWYRSSTDSNLNGAAIGGANTASYVPEELIGTTYYYVKAWTDSGLSLTTPAVAVTYTEAVAATPAPTPAPTQSPAPTAAPAVPTATPKVQPQQSAGSHRNALILLGIIIVAATAALIYTMVVLRRYDAKSTPSEFYDDEEYDDEDNTY